MTKFLQDLLEKENIILTDDILEKLDRYKALVLEWNKKFNITAITESDEFDLKHLLDSLYLLKLKEIKEAKSIIDVGTGGGFPGIPLKICQKDTKFTLLDALNKRIRFLDVVIDDLALTNIETIHGRSEDLAREEKYRDNIEVCVSRAVASLDTLAEFCLPLVKVGGYFISMKGSSAHEELDQAKKAIEILGGKLDRVYDYTLVDGDHQRSIIVIKKVKPCPDKYPRAGGAPKNKPIR